MERPSPEAKATPDWAAENSTLISYHAMKDAVKIDKVVYYVYALQRR